MSERIIILGPTDGETIKAAEITPMDAGAFLTGPWRVRLALFDGPLANATVIGPKPYERVVTEGDWRAALTICPDAIPLSLDLPLSLAEFGATTEATR